MHTMFKALAVSAALTFLASGTAFAADRIELNAAAGNQGGVFYVGMGAVGNAIMQDNPDIDYSMFPSAGLTNIIRVQNNQSQIGVIQSNNGVMALKGLAPFKSPQKNITGLVNMNTRAHTHIVVTEASGITSMEDIRDKKLPIRININPSGGNNEMMPRLVFEAYGIGWNKLRENGAKLVPLSIPDSIDMMKDGRIDVDVYHGEEPAYKYTDIMSTVNIRFLDVDPEVVKNIITPNILDGTKRTFWAYVDLNRAHVLMLRKQNIISEETCLKILKVNEELAAMRDTPTFEIDPKREDLYFNLEHYLIDRVGLQVGGQQHTARSRNDMTSTVTRMVARRAYFELCQKFIELRKTIYALAERTRDAVMAGNTHLQPSEPITFAHYCTAILYGLQRDFERLNHLYEHINECPLGGTSMGSSTWNIDRQMTSDLLGFDRPVRNSIDCVASRDYVLVFLSALTIAGNTLCRLSNDLYVWSTPDFSYVEVDDSVAVCSSIMPQKKNPWTLEFIKGKTASLEGDLVAALSTMRTTPYTYCLDLSGVAVSNLWMALDQMNAALELMIATLKDIKVNKERMLAAARTNYCTVTELANTLVRIEGISFREAHEITAMVVDWMLKHNKKADAITTDVINEMANELFNVRFEKLTQHDVDLALDPVLNVKSKDIIGGTSDRQEGLQLEEIAEHIASDEALLATRQSALSAAKAKMEALIKETLAH